ncbi:unnamed protein product, partial [Eruca vesicaria subsp. sativa]|nr:unnamed protein product [Eruca vesicaria subsp. sativa]
MSLLLGHSPKFFIRKPVLVRASDGLSSFPLQTPPCFVRDDNPCGPEYVELSFAYATSNFPKLIKKAPVELVYNDAAALCVASNASNANPKPILLPPLVTLPHCQTQIITNVSLSSPSPEEEDCVVAVKFLGTLASSPPVRVMFSKKHTMFRILGSGGQLIGSWDLCDDKHTPKFQELRYLNLPELSKAERETMHSCFTSEHLVESRST